MTAEDRHLWNVSETSLKLLKSLHLRYYFPPSRNSTTDIVNPMYSRCISCITSSEWCHIRNQVSKKPLIQSNTRIDRVKMVQLSCSFTTNCRTKCYFSRASQGRQQLIPLNSWVRLKKKKNLRDVDVSQTCISSEKKPILARIGLSGELRRPRFHDMPQISCTT